MRTEFHLSFRDRQLVTLDGKSLTGDMITRLKEALGFGEQHDSREPSPMDDREFARALAEDLADDAMKFTTIDQVDSGSLDVEKATDIIVRHLVTRAQ